jgi:adenine specific DNA methylase Mod
MYQRLILLKELLNIKGIIIVHLDWKKCHLIRAILDEVFGSTLFLNEIIWKRQSPSSSKARAKRFSADHDNLFLYTKSTDYIFNTQYGEYPENEIKKRFNKSDEKGRYKDAELATYSEETFNRLKKENRLIQTKGGKYRYKIYLSEVKGILIDTIWPDISPVNSQAQDRTDYPTQKPEALLERIIKILFKPWGYSF